MTLASRFLAAASSARRFAADLWRVQICGRSWLFYAGHFLPMMPARVRWAERMRLGTAHYVKMFPSVAAAKAFASDLPDGAAVERWRRGWTGLRRWSRAD